jgi:hypothetical protein
VIPIPLVALSSETVEVPLALFAQRVTFDAPALVRSLGAFFVDGVLCELLGHTDGIASNFVDFYTGSNDPTEIEFPPGFDLIVSETGGLVVPVTIPNTPLP